MQAWHWLELARESYEMRSLLSGFSRGKRRGGGRGGRWNSVAAGRWWWVRSMQATQETLELIHNTQQTQSTRVTRNNNKQRKIHGVKRAYLFQLWLGQWPTAWPVVAVEKMRLLQHVFLSSSPRFLPAVIRARHSPTSQTRLQNREAMVVSFHRAGVTQDRRCNQPTLLNNFQLALSQHLKRPHSASV